MFVCSFNDQDHFAYLDANGNIQDCWYDGSTGKWNLQQINRGNGPTVAGEYVATNGPAAAGDLFVSVYNGQQHFTYRDQNGNLQDAWYDGGAWHLQQINDANGAGATVPSEYIATPLATAPAAGGVFVCPFNDQDHFAYLDANGNIQDCWYDGSTGKWNLQQINRGNGPTVPGSTWPPTAGVAGDLFVSVYNGQQHFTYRDQNGTCRTPGTAAAPGTCSRSTTRTGPAPPSPASTSPRRRQPPPRNETGELHQVGTEINPPGTVEANNNMTSVEARTRASAGDVTSGG